MKKPYRYVNRLIRTDADWRAALALVAPHFAVNPRLTATPGAPFEAMLTPFQCVTGMRFLPRWTTLTSLARNSKPLRRLI